MNFPFESSHYEMIREIDCNNYSKQFIARCLTNSKLVAMKKINLEIFPFTIEGLRNEINYWVMLDHPNMLKYYGSFVEKTFLYIIVEYIDGWELSDILKERHPNGFKDEVLIASILHPVLTFLSYYHQMHYIHRSLESKHIFLKMDGDVKVGGFWKAKTLFNQENSQNDKDSNTEYNALIENEHIQQSGDIWNLGILAIEMATGKTQYSDVSSLGQVKSIVDGKASSAFLDFISLCLEKDSKKRPTAKELLSILEVHHIDHHVSLKQVEYKKVAKTSISPAHLLVTPNIPTFNKLNHGTKLHKIVNSKSLCSFKRICLPKPLCQSK